MFVRAANPIWYFVDLQGVQLNDTDYIFFLQNQFPFLPQPVYQDPNGNSVWPTPIQFFPNGTLPDNMFFDPSLVYRIEIRAGNTQADQLIYLIENFVPGPGPGPTPVPVTNPLGNQITNPQFFDINFVSPLTITTAGTYDIAPGWQLILTGGPGSATITQVITEITENNPPPGNPIPPYFLRFNLNGWSSAILQQTFNNLGDIWQNKFVSFFVLALSESGANTLTLQYKPQDPDPPIVIQSLPMSISVWTAIQGSVSIPHSSNVLSNFGSSTKMQIVLPNGTSDISDVQVEPQDTPLPVTFQQETLERQMDHEFHLYKTSILLQPKDTLLTGWNFSLNPWQFITPTPGVISPISSYVADQTILVQKTASSLQVGRSSVATNQVLAVKANNASNQFAIIQYIDPSTIFPYWQSKLSSLVNAMITTTVSSMVGIKMRLIWRSTLPTTIGNAEPIASWGSPDPTFSAGWTPLTPLNDPIYILGTSPANFVFNQFQLPASLSSTMTLGIVLYTTGNMNFTGTPDQINFNRVSLVRNDYAIDTQPLTWDEELRKCQFYYEKTSDNSIIPPGAGGNSQLSFDMLALWNGSNAWQSWAKDFCLIYNSVKRGFPVIRPWSPSAGTTGQIDAYINQVSTGRVGPSVRNFVSFWTPATTPGTKSIVYNGLFPENLLVTITGTATSPTTASIVAQFEIDARLGT